MSNKVGVVINYRTMMVGGIETNIVDIIKHFLRNDRPVIWIHSPKAKVADQYAPVMDDSRIIRYELDSSSYHWGKLKGKLNLECSYLVLSFNVHDHLRANDLARKYKNLYPVYFIPHFHGQLTFPDTLYKNTIFYKIFRDVYADFHKLIDQSGQLYFFGRRHVTEVELRYGIKIENSEEKLFQNIEQPDPISDDDLNKRARQRKERFNIISVGRMEFPHKGYMVGLMEIYARLKKKYPYLGLQYVGNGEGLEILKKKEKDLFPNGKSGIIYHGTISPENLPSLYKQCHLNIGVAGGFSQGLRNGLLSIPARHYSYSCELYGFPPESIKNSLSDVKGAEGLPLIEECITMDNERYIELSKRGYNEKLKDSLYNPEFFFELYKKVSPCKVPLYMRFLMKTNWYVEKLCYITHKRQWHILK